MLQERDTHINTQVRGLLAWNLEQTHLKHTYKECGCNQGQGFRQENITHTCTQCNTENLERIWDIVPIQFTHVVHVKTHTVLEYLTLASGPVPSKWTFCSGSSLDDFRVSEYEDTLLKRTL